MKIKTAQDCAELGQMPLQNRLDGLTSTYAVIRRAAARWPDKTAIRFLPTAARDEAGVEISYAALFARVTRTANLLHDLGIGPGDVVSYLLPNLPETHYVLWGAEAAGVVNPINPLLETDHMVAIMQAAGTKVLVASAAPDIWRKALDIKAQVPSLRHLVQVGGTGETDGSVVIYDQLVDAYPADHLASGRDIRPDDICSLFHTGGTTGVPKLAMHSHYNEVANACMLALSAELSEADVGLCGLPLFHVNGAIVTGIGCFFSGATVVLATPGGYRTPALLAHFWQIVARYQVTFFSGVPTIYAGLLQTPVGETDVSSLRMAICGAAPMPRDIIRQFEARTGLTLIEGYGLTEGTCVSCVNPLYGERRIGSIGFSMPYQDMKTVIIDGEGAYVRDCAPEEIGTVVIRGPNVFHGYLQEEANAGIWVEGDWFNTGDMGRQDAEGYFWLTGRTKELIIRGGHNIDPAIIENELVKHPAVAQVAAVGKPDAYAGELPVAYVVLKPGMTCSTAALIGFAAQGIAERAAVPKDIYQVDALPLTAVGKIFKPDLKRDAIRRVIATELAEFAAEINISVAADKTYGTVATIHYDSALSAEQIRKIRQTMGHFAFQTILKEK
ncbi:acyl-CoA synthetase [Paremcibacter congregatus]|uniref:acyl-CoA synthetase n=1 Tax=Paremcibacter congregatus TaxID=2043170 RepID=UPI003A92B181